ncbi:MAG: PAC2 family protein [Candidatus Altiarchaeota archaeon]|nr:PAC2 family protein [Candidatus Altiarchaeota archaeon]
MTTKIEIKGKLPKNPVVMEGFPSMGFVSTIATRYMIDELKMEEIGCIKSDKVKSIVVVHDSKPMHPIRIYGKDNLVLVFSEVSVPIPHIGEFSSVFSKWFKEINPEKVILLAGISGKGTDKEHEIFGVASNGELEKELERLDVSKIEEGILTGISSELLLDCIENKIPVISLMAETRYIPDPLGAASMIKILNGLLGLNVDTKNLSEKGKEIEEKFKEIAEQLKKGKEDHKGVGEYSPMYG